MSWCENSELEKPYAFQPLTPSLTPKACFEMKKESSHRWGLLPTWCAPETSTNG